MWQLQFASGTYINFLHKHQELAAKLYKSQLFFPSWIFEWRLGQKHDNTSV
jgi:hypothetical protein